MSIAKENSVLRSLYATNAENEDRRKDIIIMSVTKDDEVTGSEIIDFPMDSERCYMESIKEEKKHVVIYWKFTRFKPLLFDVVCLRIQSEEKELVTGVRTDGQKDLFEHRLEGVIEATRKRGITVAHSIMNIYEAGKIISRVKGNKRTLSDFTKISARFLEQVFFTPINSIHSSQTKEIIEKYNDLIFL